MKLLQLLRECLQKWSSISGLDFVLLDAGNRPVLSTSSWQLPKSVSVNDFRSQEADCIGSGPLSMWKVLSGDDLCYILVVHGKHEALSTICELAVCQIQSLIKACAPANNREAFIRDLLYGNPAPHEIPSRASKLHIRPDVPRVVLLIQTKQAANEEALLTVKSYLSVTRDYVIRIRDDRLAVLRELEFSKGEDQAEHLSHILVDALGAEAMTSAVVSYSSPVLHLEQISDAFTEARTALEVGQIFRTRSHVFGYDRLGIGRLIYQLPRDVCELFVHEVFGEEDPAELDQETLSTIQTLFENNLNLSETARQLFVHRNTLVYRFEKLQKRLGLDVRTFEGALTFHMAMMVVDYMRHQQPADPAAEEQEES